MRFIVMFVAAVCVLFLTKIINYCHVTNFIRFYWSYNIKVVENGYAANSAQIIPNPSRVITVLLILCTLGLSHALTSLSATRTERIVAKCAILIHVHQ